MKQETALTQLGLLATTIPDAMLAGQGLIRCLEVLGCFLSADSATLLRMALDATETARWETAECWSKPGKAVAAFRMADLPMKIQENVSKGQISRFRPAGEGPGSKSEFLLIPLFLNKRFSALIALHVAQAVRMTPVVRGFLYAALKIFELWLLKLNSDKRFDDVIEFLPSPTIGLDREGIATIWNPAVEQMTGWEASRILGKSDYEYALPFWGHRRPITPNLIMDPDPYYESTYHSFKKEGDIVYTLMFMPALTRGGSFLTGSTRRMRDLSGRVCGALHIVRDVTRERLIESRLQSSESMFKTITDYAGLGIALFAKEKPLYYNERFETLLGISGREITIEDLLEDIEEEARHQTRRRIEAMFSGEAAGPLRVNLSHKNSERNRYYSIYAQVLDYEGKQTICFVLDDVTAQKELAEKAKLNELKMYHEGRLTSLGIMAAGIAHELNQPLNTIRVITDGILFGRDEGWDFNEGEIFESMEMITKQVMRMSAVIQNVRNFSREEREETFIDINANHAIENVLSMIGRQFEAHNISLHANLEFNLPLIKASLNRLEQVIMNLLVNARQALDSCQRHEKHLWIKTGSNADHLLIEVADNATGIPAENMERIFDPFFTTKEVGHGTGLGLTISRSIVKEFKGDIEAVNNPLGGATFILRLPVQRGSR